MRSLVIPWLVLLLGACGEGQQGGAAGIDAGTDAFDAMADDGAAGSDASPEAADISGGFQGFGVQLWEALYRAGSVAPSTVDPASNTMRDEIIDVAPGHVRIFVPNAAAMDPTSPDGADAKQSFHRVVDLAQAAGATVNVTWPGGYTGTGVDFARPQMEGLAALLHEEIDAGHTAIQYVTIQNEGNTANPDKVCPGQEMGTYICRVDMNQAYRTLDAALRAFDPPLRGPGAVHPIRFIGGDLVFGRPDHDNYYQDWMTWMHQNMDDVLDGWSIHVYWLYFNHDKPNDPSPATGSGVTMIRQAMAHRRALGGKPLYIMESGVRGYADRVTHHYPGFYEPGCTAGQAGCTPIEDTAISSAHQATFDLTAARLGYRAVTKWEATRRDDSSWGILGAPWNDWPQKPSYDLRRMWNAAVRPGWLPFAVATTSPAPSTTLAGMRSPTGDVRSILAINDSTTARDVTIKGLAPNTAFKVWSWNQPGLAGQTCYRPGKVSTAAGTLTVTLHARNALVATTTTRIAGFPPCP